MLYKLYIEAFSEAEIYFIQLTTLLGVTYEKVALSIWKNGELCNVYLVNDETYNTIREYLIEKESI